MCIWGLSVRWDMTQAQQIVTDLTSLYLVLQGLPWPQSASHHGGGTQLLARA